MKKLTLTGYEANQQQLTGWTNLGSFITALFRAYSLADLENQYKMEATFPDYFVKEYEFSIVEPQPEPELRLADLKVGNVFRFKESKKYGMKKQFVITGASMTGCQFEPVEAPDKLFEEWYKTPINYYGAVHLIKENISNLNKA